MKVKLKALNSKLMTLFFVFLTIIICGLRTLRCELLYGQDEFLNVKGDTKTNTVDFDTFGGDAGGFPSTPVKGEAFYNFNATYKQPYYYNGTAWQAFGGEGPKTVASRIVAASNSLDKSRADYACNGTADQYWINTAINATGANGGAIYLLEGTYNITSSINMASNVSLIGTGAGTVLRRASAIDNIILANGSPTSPIENILIAQLKIDGVSKTNTNGIYFDFVNNSKIDRIWMTNISKVNTDGIQLASSARNVISNCRLENGGGDAINLQRSSAVDPGSSNNIIQNNHVDTWGEDGIYAIGSSNNCIVSGNIFTNSYGAYAAIWVRSGNNWIISNNEFYSNNKCGIWVSSDYCVISGNNIHDNTGQGIILYEQRPDNNIVSNNIINNNNKEGILISTTESGGYSYAERDILIGNIIIDNGDASIAAYDGINIVGSSDGSGKHLISSNLISAASGRGGGYGINVKANSDNNYISSNYIDGAGFTAKINDAGTNTTYTDKIKMTFKKRTVTSLAAQLDVATTPASYVYLTNGGTLNLANGKSAGDLLVLENGSTNSITVNDSGNINLEVSPSRTLNQFGILKLIWNGSRWLEMEYVQN